MRKEWNRKIVSAVVTHFVRGMQDESIHTHYEGQDRDSLKKNWAEVRITDIKWRQLDATQYLCRFAVNVLCSTPSGLDSTEPQDLYAIEDMLGIAQALFWKSIFIEGFGCLSLDTSIDLEVLRPRQVDTATNLKQAGVTGYYLLRINKEDN